MEELIRKKKLIADLKGIKDMLMAAGDPFLASVMNRAIACVENQPVVEVSDMVHGQWLSRDFLGIAYDCSECGYVEVLQLTDFCPSCGAKMDGETEAG